MDPRMLAEAAFPRTGGCWSGLLVCHAGCSNLLVLVFLADDDDDGGRWRWRAWEGGWRRGVKITMQVAGSERSSLAWLEPISTHVLSETEREVQKLRLGANPARHA